MIGDLKVAASWQCHGRLVAQTGSGRMRWFQEAAPRLQAASSAWAFSPRAAERRHNSIQLPAIKVNPPAACSSPPADRSTILPAILLYTSGRQPDIRPAMAIPAFKGHCATASLVQHLLEARSGHADASIIPSRVPEHHRPAFLVSYHLPCRKSPSPGPSLRPRGSRWSPASARL